jgi:acetoin utilization deacetylase AcuC-like enzyme
VERRVYWHRLCLEHPAPPGYPERPERLELVLQALRADLAAGSEPIEADPHRDDVARAIGALHDPLYVERFARAVGRGDGLLDAADNPIGTRSFEAGRAAAAAALAAADWIAAGDSRHAFAAVRPPGHHAERDRAMGFCFFNNAALAAQRLIEHGLDRVAIVDFDVHHGNGTQHLFEERADVLFISLHQFPFYPGTGAAAEIGIGAGRGATLNLPLAAGSGDHEYESAFRDSVLPALERFAPRALVVSAGFDAWQGDPLGGMLVSRQGFRSWGEWLGAAAERLCEGRLAAVLEGGYDLDALPVLASEFWQACA